MISTGELGERVACRHLRRRGYRVVARNLRRKGGEVDIVCVKDGVVVFCEVKTRTTATLSTAFEAVDARKRARVLRVGRRWLRERRVPRAPHRLALVLVGLAPAARGWRRLLGRRVEEITLVDPLAEVPPRR